MKMIGIIDEFGIESFTPFDAGQSFLLMLRAKLNQQRTAVFYCLEFTDKEINKINHLISSNDVRAYNEASIIIVEKLNSIKQTANIKKLLNRFYELKERL